MKGFKTFEPIETASKDELQALQTKRMKWTLEHAYQNSPMYKHKFDQVGVHPSDFEELKDIQKFPYTTKQDLRDHYPFDSFAVPQKDIVRVHASSGTTGKPTVVGYTKRDIETWSKVVARSIYTAGGRATDIVHVAYGYGLFTGGLGAHYGAEYLGATVIPVSGGQTEKQVQLIQDFKPSIIMVTPSYCLNLLDKLEQEMGGDASSCSLKLGIFGAEPWTNEMRQEIESRLGINAVDIYGLSEVIGPGVAMECGIGKDGPTIWEDHFYPEIIDPSSAEVLEDQKEGELVFTSLTKEGMPIIRYRTRDLTRLLPGNSRVMRRMDKITGRSDDMLNIRGVNVFPSQIEEQLLHVEGLSPHYQLEIIRKNHLDHLVILVEAKSDMYFARKDALQLKLQQRIKSMVGISTYVEVVPVKDIPRSEGKAIRVIDHRAPKAS